MQLVETFIQASLWPCHYVRHSTVFPMNLVFIKPVIVEMLQTPTSSLIGQEQLICFSKTRTTTTNCHYLTNLSLHASRSHPTYPLSLGVHCSQPVL